MGIPLHAAVPDVHSSDDDNAEDAAPPAEAVRDAEQDDNRVQPAVPRRGGLVGGIVGAAMRGIGALVGGGGGGAPEAKSAVCAFLENNGNTDDEARGFEIVCNTVHQHQHHFAAVVQRNQDNIMGIPAPEGAAPLRQLMGQWYAGLVVTMRAAAAIHYEELDGWIEHGEFERLQAEVRRLREQQRQPAAPAAAAAVQAIPDAQLLELFKRHVQAGFEMDEHFARIRNERSPFFERFSQVRDARELQELWRGLLANFRTHVDRTVQTVQNFMDQNRRAVNQIQTWLGGRQDTHPDLAPHVPDLRRRFPFLVERLGEAWTINRFMFFSRLADNFELICVYWFEAGRTHERQIPRVEPRAGGALHVPGGPGGPQEEGEEVEMEENDPADGELQTLRNQVRDLREQVQLHTAAVQRLTAARDVAVRNATAADRAREEAERLTAQHRQTAADAERALQEAQEFRRGREGFIENQAAVILRLTEEGEDLHRQLDEALGHRARGGQDEAGDEMLRAQAANLEELGDHQARQIRELQAQLQLTLEANAELRAQTLAAVADAADALAAAHPPAPAAGAAAPPPGVVARDVQLLLQQTQAQLILTNANARRSENQVRDLQRQVDELRRENDQLRAAGGQPPPGGVGAAPAPAVPPVAPAAGAILPDAEGFPVFDRDRAPGLLQEARKSFDKVRRERDGFRRDNEMLRARIRDFEAANRLLAAGAANGRQPPAGDLNDLLPDVPRVPPARAAAAPVAPVVGEPPPEGGAARLAELQRQLDASNQVIAQRNQDCATQLLELDRLRGEVQRLSAEVAQNHRVDAEMLGIALGGVDGKQPDEEKIRDFMKPEDEPADQPGSDLGEERAVARRVSDLGAWLGRSLAGAVQDGTPAYANPLLLAHCSMGLENARAIPVRAGELVTRREHCPGQNTYAEVMLVAMATGTSPYIKLEWLELLSSWYDSNWNRVPVYCIAKAATVADTHRMINFTQRWLPAVMTNTCDKLFRRYVHNDSPTQRIMGVAFSSIWCNTSPNAGVLATAWNDTHHRTFNILTVREDVVFDETDAPHESSEDPTAEATYERKRAILRRNAQDFLDDCARKQARDSTRWMRGPTTFIHWVRSQQSEGLWMAADQVANDEELEHQLRPPCHFFVRHGLGPLSIEVFVMYHILEHVKRICGRAVFEALQRLTIPVQFQWCCMVDEWLARQRQRNERIPSSLFIPLMQLLTLSARFRSHIVEILHTTGDKVAATNDVMKEIDRVLAETNHAQ